MTARFLFSDALANRNISSEKEGWDSGLRAVLHGQRAPRGVIRCQ